MQVRQTNLYDAFQQILLGNRVAATNDLVHERWQYLLSVDADGQVFQRAQAHQIGANENSAEQPTVSKQRRHLTMICIGTHRSSSLSFSRRSRSRECPYNHTWPSSLNALDQKQTTQHRASGTWCCMRTHSLFISAKFKSTKSMESCTFPWLSLRKRPIEVHGQL